MGAAQKLNDYDWKIIPGQKPRFIVIDLFCGAGGTTIGYKQARLRLTDEKPGDNDWIAAMVIACINHDPGAIKSHWRNNKEVAHFNEDITKLYGTIEHGYLFKSPEFMRFIRLVEMYRAFYPEAKIILWASLECTNFSKAKGGQSRDADSRTLAEHLDRYITAIDPDYIKIENVVEFMAWGPMRIKAKKVHMNVEHPYTELTVIKDKKTGEYGYGMEPISKKNGQDWLRWCKSVCNLGYEEKWKELNSADYGAYTSRNRLFGMFSKPGIPAIFPVPTHAKKPSPNGGLFTPLKKWMPVKEVLDFDDEGKSILNRLKSTNSPRILLANGKKVKEIILLPADCLRPHAHHEQAFKISQAMIKDFDEIVAEYKMVYGSVIFYYDDELSDKTKERVFSGLVKYVAGGKDKHAFMQQTYACASNNAANYPVDQPARTVTVRDSTQLVQASFLSQYNSGAPDSRNTPLDEPCRTLLTENTYALVNPNFITKAYSGRPDGKVISVEGPAGTITTVDGQSLVQPQFIVQSNGGNPDAKVSSVEDPSRVITTADNKALVSPEFLVQRNSGNPDGRIISVDGPARTLTATSGNQDLVQPAFLAKYHGRGENLININDPASTLTTKDRLVKIQAIWLDKNYNGPENHQSVNVPAGTIMTKDHYSLVQPEWIDRNFSGGGQHSDITEPAGTVMPVPKMNLMQTKFIVSPHHNNGSTSSMEDPFPTITAGRKHHLLINPQYSNVPAPVDKPCFTLIASMDSYPPYLLTTTEGELAIMVYDSDSDITVKIKEFMALYGIADIKMRMLKVPELLKIQGFPSSYHLEGSQADKKKFIGNSVVPHIVKCWAEQLAYELDKYEDELKFAA